MTLGFVLFGLRDNSGCTTNAVHIARYFANSGLSVALIESGTIKSPCLRDYIDTDDIPCMKDGVLLYPTWNEELPESDIIVYDMGTTGAGQVLKFAQETNGKNYKYFLSFEVDEEADYTLRDFLSRIPAEIKSNLTILVKECGEQKLAELKKIHFRTYKISYSRTTCPLVLSDVLTGICNFNGIIPPSINYDLGDWFSEIKTGIEKKPLFGFMRPKKTSLKEKIEDQIREDSIPDLSVDTFLFDEDGLPIPADDEDFKGLEIHERDPDLKNKPDLEYSSEEDYEKSYELKRRNMDQNSVSTGEAVSNMVDGLKDAGGLAVNGIFNILGKLKRKKKEDNEEDSEQDAEDIRITATNSEQSTNEVSAPDGSEAPDTTEDQKTTGSRDDSQTSKSGTAKKIFSFIGKMQDGLKTHAENESTDISVADIEEYDALQQAEQSPPPEKEKSSKLKFAGHLTVFITALKHGAGCSHVAASLGASLAGVNNTICFVHDKRTESPEGRYMTSYTDRDYGKAYSMGRTVIFDLGCLGELTREAMERVQMADVRILVCGSSENDISALARFIHKSQESAKEWLYVFNLTSGNRKKNRISELMQEYDYIFLKSHDYEDISRDIVNTWNKQIRKKIK